MKYVVLVALIAFGATAQAKNGRPFNCVSGTGANDLLSIEACVNDDGDELRPCKGQDKRHLGTAYLKLEKVTYRSDRSVKAPVIQTVMIPSELVKVDIDKEAFRVVVDSKVVGELDVRMPTNPYAPNGKENGRYFSVRAGGIEAEVGAVVCQFRK